MIGSLWGAEKLGREGQNFLANYATPDHRWSGITDPSAWMNCLSLWKALTSEVGSFVCLILSYIVCNEYLCVCECVSCAQRSF